VGSLVADYARRWGFGVECCDPPRQRAGERGFVTLGEVAARCDIVTFHTPLTRAGDDATWHLADRRFFDTLRPAALLLNAARGEVVDTQALLHAIENNATTCCIDTWEGEPAIDRRLSERALLATPHIAGYSAQGKANATSMVVEAVARGFGLPLEGWYPDGEVMRVVPRPIAWDELRATIGSRFDIAALSRTLKSAPDRFERLRNDYPYRQEYF
jgi:erythronate-4-phosphate dehydrogenase